MKEKEIIDWFFKFAFCKNCDQKELQCKCKMMTPIMYYTQFKDAVKKDV